MVLETKLGGRVRHPAPINQFYRLGYDEVTANYVKVSRWDHIHRNSGGKVIDWDAYLCMAAEGAVALDAHTGGRIVTSPGRIHDLQSDMSGGIGVDDVEDAWRRGWGQDLIVPSAFNRNDVLDAVNERRHVVIGMDYRGFDYAAQADDRFDHALGFDDMSSSSRVLHYDSLRSMPFWGNPDSALDGAERLAMRVRGTKERLFVGITAIRPARSTAAPHYAGTTIRPTSLYNDETDRWVFNGTNRLPSGTRIEVRGVQYDKGGIRCYPCTTGSWASKYGPPYFVPVSNIKLGGRV